MNPSLSSFLIEVQNCFSFTLIICDSKSDPPFYDLIPFIHPVMVKWWMESVFWEKRALFHIEFKWIKESMQFFNLIYEQDTDWSGNALTPWGNQLCIRVPFAGLFNRLW